jgi:hypothetical protein
VEGIKQVRPGWASSTQTRNKPKNKLTDASVVCGHRASIHPAAKFVDTNSNGIDSFPLSSYFSTVITSATTYPPPAPRHAVTRAVPVTLSCPIPPAVVPCVSSASDSDSSGDEVDDGLYEELSGYRRHSVGSFCSSESCSESDYSGGTDFPPYSPSGASESSIDNDIALFLSDESII